MVPLAINLMVGLGDTRRRAERSLDAAIKARAPQGKTKDPVSKLRYKSEGAITRDGDDAAPDDDAARAAG